MELNLQYEVLFEEARRNTKPEHEKWEKYYNRRRRDVQIKRGIGYHSRTPLVRIAGTLNSQRYISEVYEPVVLPYLQGLATAIFQQDNARPHVACIIQRFFVNHQIELLSWPVRFPDHLPIENMLSMVDQRLT
ncbi:transposable element Tcb1 transposase [Trichonephila clavipes]|nr:transposable element Tcb1 transposase [Trichonephila clavipes]